MSADLDALKDLGALRVISAHNLAECLPDALIVARADTGIVLFMNRRAELLFNYEREQVIGKAVEMLMPEEFRPRHRMYRQSFASDPALRPMGERGVQLSLLRSDGSTIPVEIMLGPMPHSTGLLVVVTLRKVSPKAAPDASAE